MVVGYKIQDTKVKRDMRNIEDYITPEWIIERYIKTYTCRCCKNPMYFEKHDECELNVNGLDKCIAHTKANCELLCPNCNKSLK